MINISTGGFGAISASEASVKLLKKGIKNLELSGGAYSASLLRELQSLRPDAKFQVHNYFPPSEKAFVLNLGSLDPVIGDLSIAHVEKALRWCSALGADRYSFHAGFLLDPKVDELGRRIPNRNLFDREQCIEVFVRRVSNLAKLAKKVGINLMIENNVLSAKNANEFPTNPLLMCDPQECSTVIKLMPENVNLLIDVAHLKVTANSLKFNPSHLLELCSERVAGYHLSDNNGLEDSNMPFSDDAWFWPHLKKDVDYYTVEVYRCSPQRLMQQADLVRSKLNLSEI